MSGVVSGILHFGASGRSKREVPIEEGFKENGSCAGFSFAGTVVRDKKSDVLIEDKVEVAVEENGIASVADDASIGVRGGPSAELSLNPGLAQRPGVLVR